MSSLPSDAAIVHELVTVDSVAATLAALTIAVEAVDGQTLAYIDRTDDADTALCLLAQVRTQRIRLATIEASLESLAARRMRAEHRDRVELPGVGLFERRGGVDRKDWDHRGVASRVVRTLLVDPTTGEAAPEEYRDFAYLLRDRLLEACRTEWRTTALRKLGVDPDEFCTKTPGRTTIQFTPAGG
jgi:hypothetical protein